jgi:2-polyprenyl-3-methyl-5-hydroxy-6-metoxy-1,4-benzoquinol methylase
MDYLPNWSAAGLDWIHIWRDMHDRERKQGNDFTHPDMRIGDDYYVDAGARFANFVTRFPQPDGFMKWLLPMLNSGDTILDIGAGSGRYLTTLVASGCHVIALEPSKTMISYMNQTIHENKLGNSVTVIHDKWPSVQSITCDVAISVQVLDAVRDIEPFLHHMNSSTKKLCVILLGVPHPTTPLHELWQKYHGTTRLPIPSAYECQQVLAQMGIMANVHIFPRPSFVSFPNLDDAVAESCFRLRLPDDANHRAIISEIILADWIIQNDGTVVIPHSAPHTAIIWWNPE